MMTDEARKIVEALRHCGSRHTSCFECPLSTTGTPTTDECDSMLTTSADLIERLSVELEAAKRCEWISVEDRLPEPGITKLIVTVRHENGNIVDMARYLGIQEGWDLVSWKFWDKNVTHWMPLPEMPKEG